MGKAAKGSWSANLHYRFAVGHDRQGRWVVCDAKGIAGGIFKDRASAIKFAMDESDHQPGQIFCVPDTQVLSINAVFAPTPAASPKILRRAA